MATERRQLATMPSRTGVTKSAILRAQAVTHTHVEWANLGSTCPAPYPLGCKFIPSALGAHRVWDDRFGHA